VNILIVYAHPNPESFNQAILRRVSAGFEANKQAIKVIDLYKEQFDPVLRFDESHPRRELHNSMEMAKYRDLVVWADHLVFIYPVWWYGLPAILKGFFDRVFVSGFAYATGNGFPKGLLFKKTAWIISTIDSPIWFVKLFRLNAENRIIRSAILGYCGVRNIKIFMFTGTRSSSLASRQRWLDKLEAKATKFGVTKKVDIHEFAKF